MGGLAVFSNATALSCAALLLLLRSRQRIMPKPSPSLSCTSSSWERKLNLLKPLPWMKLLYGLTALTDDALRPRVRKMYDFFCLVWLVTLYLGDCRDYGTWEDACDCLPSCSNWWNKAAAICARQSQAPGAKNCRRIQRQAHYQLERFSVDGRPNDRGLLAQSHQGGWNLLRKAASGLGCLRGAQEREYNGGDERTGRWGGFYSRRLHEVYPSKVFSIEFPIFLLLGAGCQLEQTIQGTYSRLLQHLDDKRRA